MSNLKVKEFSVPVVADFRDINNWIAPKGADAKDIVRTTIDNPKHVDYSGITAYLPDTAEVYLVKNQFAPDKKGIICQQSNEQWEPKMQAVMKGLELELNNTSGLPYLIDEKIWVPCSAAHGTEMGFAAVWFIRSWKIDLIIGDDLGGRGNIDDFEVVMLRDKIKWVKCPKNHSRSKFDTRTEQPDEVHTASYWFPYSKT